MLTLPNDVARCSGEFSEHWQKQSNPCPKRDECARHAVIYWDDVLNRDGWFTHMRNCVDDGRLTAFIPFLIDEPLITRQRVQTAVRKFLDEFTRINHDSGRKN